MADVDIDPAVRIVVAPSQSSYFAGEPFSVTITFTNTRSAGPVLSRTISHSHAHRRNVHSVSSAPITRLPTSPGTPRTPRTAVPVPPHAGQDSKPSKKGLVGRTSAPPTVPSSTTGSLPALVESRRKKMLSRSLSVSIAPPDLHLTSRDGMHTPQSATFSPHSPVSPQLLSLSISRRSDTLPLAASHPHARKPSILDGLQLQRQELLSSLTSPSSSTPYPPSASSSTFSLALDPITESGVHPYPPTPVLPSAPAMGSPVPIALGHLPPAPVSPRATHSTTFTPPHTELVLYAYASLAGHAVLAPLAGSGTPAFAALRSVLLRPGPGRGGSLSLQAAGAPPRHRRSSSFSTGLRALGAGLGIWTRSAGGMGADAGAGSGADTLRESDPDAPVPTLEVTPEMLAVDLSLRPGESRSYTYTLLLPANLPPTFEGRTLGFSYELVVGVCRAVGSSSVSRVMKVPIRVYNNVVVDQPTRPYDLLWPLSRRIGTPATTPAVPPTSASQDNLKPTVEEHRRPAPPAAPATVAPPPKAQQAGSVAELERYATRLLAATTSPSPAGFPWGVGEDGHSAAGDGGGLSGCREAIEVLTRNLKKVSYDITKDGETVAVLTFPKTSFRLGETVDGAVEVNWREGRGRVLQVTALLETHESLPTALAAPPSTPATGQYLRRAHAEHHAQFVLGTLRLGFSLDIPSDGSPAFGVVASGVAAGADDGGSAGGLEWLVRLCLLVGVAQAESDAGTEGVRAKGLVRDADGRGTWVSAWRAPTRLGVLERMPPPSAPPPSSALSQPQAPGWGAFLAASFLDGRDGGYHDGDDFDDEEELEGADGAGAEAEEETHRYDGVKGDFEGGVGVGVRYGGLEEGWSEVRAQMVECVVPVQVWAGNTAFRAGDVVFDV
ncbi:Rgp1-domain-containing protein [Mycena epipterygia]|nr:Rgp1-domain-containing protein [Mycena epipterygia]